MQSQTEGLHVRASKPIRARQGWEPMQASLTNRQEFAKFFVDLVQATPATEAEKSFMLISKDFNHGRLRVGRGAACQHCHQRSGGLSYKTDALRESRSSAQHFFLTGYV